MKISYDKKVDAMYIHLRKGRYALTKKITDSLLIDLDKRGRVIGVEILDASRQIADFSPDTITFSWVDVANSTKKSSVSSSIA